MITKDLGAVSAYAYAVGKGYTGTEAEYAELMASYASVAQQAGESAQTAQTAQQTATAKASEAQQSATTATTKAQEASQSASESSQSASTAVQAKEDAQTAKTASETAQASAESARDDAETARDTAQQYAESIDPQKLIGAYPVDTATGAIASFPDGADNIPMKKVIVRIEPKQAGTGDPSPDNVRPISGWDSVVVSHSGVNRTNPTTKTIPLPQTVYGGTLDVTTGELVVDRAYGVLNNPDRWDEVSGTANFRYNVPFDSRKTYDDSYSGLTCSYVPCLYGAEPYGRWNSALGAYFCIKSSALTLEQVKADTEAGKISIVYELATPITLTLSPTEIKSLLADNNVWADCGDTTVTYRADTALYINRKIAEAVSALS